MKVDNTCIQLFDERNNVHENLVLIASASSKGSNISVLMRIFVSVFAACIHKVWK